MKYSIYDVAERAGVSIATVSRVINDKGYISKSTKEKVLKAFNDLEYFPNEVARSFAKNASNTIGVYFPNVNKSLFEYDYLIELFKGITEGLANTNFDILLIQEDYSLNITENDSKPRYFNYIKGRKIDGLILGVKFDDDIYLRKLVDEDMPVVYVGSRLEPEGGYNVYGNFMKYTKDVMSYCYDRGHTNIGILNINNPQEQRLSTVYKDFYEEKGLKIDWSNLINIDNDEFLYERLKEIMEKENAPTVLYIPNLLKVQKVVTMINAMGKKIPEDISIISSEHKEKLAESIFPPITSVFIPAYEMGKSCAELLIKILENNPVNTKEILFNPEIIERKSVLNLN